MTKEIQPWKDTSIVAVPASVSDPKEIVTYAKALKEREARQLVNAFAAGDYELGASFAWQKSMVALKKRLGALGMAFIGEMLQRSDLSDSSAPEASLSDYDAINLASELGMVSASEALRLRQCLETLNHFLDDEVAEDDGLTPEEAVRCLRVCVQTALTDKGGSAPLIFVEFRSSLEERKYDEDDQEIQRLLDSPYFFLRTILNAILALLKTSEGAQLAHASANALIIIPLIWSKLLRAEKHRVGLAYAEVASSGTRERIVSFRKILMKVQGFDFVPENLRSNTFIRAAQALIDVHYAMDNYHNEPPRMKALYQLGSTIPLPAFAKCLTATLIVVLGNEWGYSFGAQTWADKTLQRLTKEEWRIYLMECLPSDENVLSKLDWGNAPRKRWREIVKEYELANIDLADSDVEALVAAGHNGPLGQIENAAHRLLRRYRRGRA